MSGDDLIMWLFFIAFLLIIIALIIGKITSIINVHRKASRQSPVSIYGLTDEAEADVLKSFLAENNIEHLIIPLKNYNDVWQWQDKWGILQVSPKDELRARDAVIAYLRTIADEQLTAGQNQWMLKNGPALLFKGKSILGIIWFICYCFLIYSVMWFVIIFVAIREIRRRRKLWKNA